MIATGAARQRVNAANWRHVRLINLLYVKRRRVTRAPRQFLECRQPRKARVLRVSLNRPIKYNLRYKAILIKGSNKQARSVLGRHNPPYRLRFTAGLQRARLADVRVLSRFIRSSANRFVFRTTSFQRNVGDLAIVGRNLRARLSDVRVNKSRVTTHQDHNRRNIGHDRVTSRHVRYNSSIIRLNKRRQPSTI